MATASMLMCAHVRRGLLRETADFVAKFKDGFEAGFVAAGLLKGENLLRHLHRRIFFFYEVIAKQKKKLRASHHY